MRRLIWACMIWGAVFGMGVSAQQAVDTPPQIELRIGVRSFARPFSFKSESLLDVLTAATPGPLAKSYYSGYMVKICDAVLTELLIDPKIKGGLRPSQIKAVDLDKVMIADTDHVGGRFGYFFDHTTEERAQLSRIDILCDPATITNERRQDLMISPPVYLTGISYITSDSSHLGRDLNRNAGCPRRVRDDPDGVSFLIGMVGQTTAVSGGIRALLDAGELPQYRAHMIGYLQNDQSCRLSKQLETILARLKQEKGMAWRGPVGLFRSHQDAAEAFCKGYIDYYIGDREIIADNARAIPGCEFDNSAQTFTTDRYAIFGRIDYQGDPVKALLVARFFEILSKKILAHPSIIDQVFYDTFHPTEPTQALRLFFRSIRGSP